MRLGRKTGWIGIDLGTAGLKLVQAERVGRRVRIAASVVLQRPSSSRAETNMERGECAWRGGDLAAALSLAPHLSGRRAACVLPMRHTEMHVMSIPPGAEAERRAMIAHELKSQSVADQREREFDFWDADSVAAADSPAGQNVNVLSVPRELVSQVIRSLSNARLSCEVMDGLPFALARAVTLAYGSGETSPIAAVDWGFTSATFCVVSRGKPQFTRHLRNCGFGLLVGAVGRTLGFSDEEATRILSEYGLPEGHGQQDAGRETQEVIAEVASGQLNELAQELEKTISYVRMQYSALTPGRLCLLGGGGTVKNVTRALSERLGLPVETWRLPDAEPKGSDTRENPLELLSTATALSTLAWT